MGEVLCNEKSHQKYKYHKKNMIVMSPNLHIVKARDLGNLQVLVFFSDNKEQTIDIGDFIRRHPHPQYNKYLNPKNFKKFAIENGNIVWGKNWDLIFPIEQLYEGKIV